jgi:DNA-binding transcriptional LysR family regulator
LVLPRFAVSSVLAPKLGQIAREYPDILLDVTTDDNRIDIIARGFDAGIHFGEFIEKDMIAVRVSPDQRAAIVGSPEYFQSHPKPKSPRDLTGHQCINFRHGSRGQPVEESGDTHQGESGATASARQHGGLGGGAQPAQSDTGGLGGVLQLRDSGGGVRHG